MRRIPPKFALVMAGLDPAIHGLVQVNVDVDHRDKPGGDQFSNKRAYCAFGLISYDTLTDTRSVSSPGATGTASAMAAAIFR